MNLFIDKRILNIFVIALLSLATITWTFWVFHQAYMYSFYISVITLRILASVMILQDFSLSWSKASAKTFLIKSVVFISAFFIYAPFFYGKVRIAFMLSELFLFLFSINFLVYAYNWFINRTKSASKTSTLYIYGAGQAGVKLANELRQSRYNLKGFFDDDEHLQTRSIDGVKISSMSEVLQSSGHNNGSVADLLVIAMPSVPSKRINEIYDASKGHFKEIKILPPLTEILRSREFALQLRDISLDDFLARHPKDLDKEIIGSFLRGKRVLVTGAGGSIGSEICRQCIKYEVEKLYCLDHSEFNLYQISEELGGDITPILHSVLDISALEKTMLTCKPEIIIHAAAYKHVPLVESNMAEGIRNNILGTKNCIDMSIKYEVEKFIFISTDKAVRPTSVMGASKRVCELYAGNVDSKKTQIVSVRFGNVLGSSGSVIPKFRAQIENGGPVTVTHPQMTRYFMLIPEACELVLQAGAIGKAGEIFILDMGEPVKIVDLAQKMIDLSGRKNIAIEFTGLRPGEKLFEELLVNESEGKTKYPSIMVATQTIYDIQKLQADIAKLLECKDKVNQLKKMLPEFTHKIDD